MNIVRRFRKSAVTLLAIIVGGTVAAACYSGTGPKTIVLGDSIVGVSVWTINNTLTTGNPSYAVNVQGQPGFTIGQSEPELQTMLTDPEGAPQNAVIDLGTNDVFEGTATDANWRSDLATMASNLQSTPCVIWVNVNTLVDQQWPGTGTTAEDINTVISALPSQYANMHVIDWNGVIQQGNNAGLYLYQNAPYLGTNIHPNPAGQAELANLIQLTLNQDCPA